MRADRNATSVRDFAEFGKLAEFGKVRLKRRSISIKLAEFGKVSLAEFGKIAFAIKRVPLKHERVTFFSTYI